MFFNEEQPQKTPQITDQLELDRLLYADNYFDFLTELRKATNREVDLVIEKDLSNPILIEEINASKALIYEQEDSKGILHKNLPLLKSEVESLLQKG